MYLPKSKQKKGGKPQGKLIDPKSGLPFLGAFVMDHLGNLFKGTKITSKSEPLELIPDETEDPKSTFVNVKRTPSEKDYSKGTFTRFFAKDGRTGKVVELDKEKYLAQKKEGKLYRRTIKIEWYVTGNPEDEIINGYLYPGTKAKNQDVINQAEKILPGIGEQILKDPGQFVRK
jgi:hypothetical protein